MHPSLFAKAVVASAIAGLGAATAASLDGSLGLNDWLVTIGAGLVGFQATYWVPNSTDTPSL